MFSVRYATVLIYTFCCLSMGCFFSFDFALAAGLAKKGVVSLQETFNPQPDAADLLLPMPCDLAMPMKVVGVPVTGYLGDLELFFGCDDCERPGMEFYERQYPSGISGPFRMKDLPPAWQKRLADSGEASLLTDKALYVIGKYEVTNQQWDAVMSGTCPQGVVTDGAKPKGDISWFDSLEFSRKYMQWLLQEHKDSLPQFAGDDKNLGYLRLPTEKEWEYAARGGHRVKTDSLRTESLFERDPALPITEYAVYAAEGGLSVGSALNIGSRKPNPLGIYDSAGNVAEMVLDPFSFSSGGRLVGAAGGFVRKGGSFLTGLGEIYPGRREECAFYVKTGENKARDMGFRLVLSTVNIPTAERLALVEKEWEKSGKIEATPQDAPGSISNDVEKLLALATKEQKKIIDDLQQNLKDRNIALIRQQEQMAQLQVKSSLYMVDSIRNLFIRRKAMKNQIEQLEVKLAASPQDAGIAESIARHKEFIGWFDAAINSNVTHYKILVEESSRFSKDVFEKAVDFVTKEMAIPANDEASKWQGDNLKKCFEKYNRHLDWYRAGNTKSLSIDSLRKDMVSKEYW